MLRNLHKSISDKTGCTIAGDYGFHLTLAYKIIHLSKEEELEKMKIDKRTSEMTTGKTVCLEAA